MDGLDHTKLHTRAEMVRVLMRAGQFAHLSEADFVRSLDSLWDISVRMAWLSEGETHYHHSTWAERAVSIGLVKAAETGLMKRGYFDARAVDWIARTEPTLCCLCLNIGETFKGVYDIPLEFTAYVCPTFETYAAPYYVRRPFCGPCSWAIASGVRVEEGTTSDLRRRTFRSRLDHSEDVWNSVLARLTQNAKFRDRVMTNADNATALRFDPRRT